MYVSMMFLCKQQTDMCTCVFVCVCVCVSVGIMCVLHKCFCSLWHHIYLLVWMDNMHCMFDLYTYNYTTSTTARSTPVNPPWLSITHTCIFMYLYICVCVYVYVCIYCIAQHYKNAPAPVSCGQKLSSWSPDRRERQNQWTHCASVSTTHTFSWLLPSKLWSSAYI